MANERWNLHTGADLDAEAGEAEGLINPPLTVAARLTAREAMDPPYGSAPKPPTPEWYLNDAGQPIAGGFVRPTSIELFWRSFVGYIARGKESPPVPPALQNPLEAPSPGAAGLNCAGIIGHHIYIGEAAAPPTTPSLTLHGPAVNTVITSFFAPAPIPDPPPDPPVDEPPVTVAIKPGTEYRINIAAIGADGTVGPTSTLLTVTTPAATTAVPPYFTPPNPPSGFTYDPDENLPDPDVTPLPGFSLIWEQVRGATSYEIYTNTSRQTAIAMDPARPGLMVGDVLAGTATQPTEPGPVRFTTPAVTADTPYVIKVRAVRTGTDPVSGQPVTAYSAFAPALRYFVPKTDTIVPPPRPAKKTAAKTTTSGT